MDLDAMAAAVKAGMAANDRQAQIDRAAARLAAHVTAAVRPPVDAERMMTELAESLDAIAQGRAARAARDEANRRRGEAAYERAWRERDGQDASFPVAASSRWDPVFRVL
jgi:hypothetical protein